MSEIGTLMREVREALAEAGGAKEQWVREAVDRAEGALLRLDRVLAAHRMVPLEVPTQPHEAASGADEDAG
jgi:hypothetical protein